MTQNFFWSSLKFIFRDLIGDLLYFPIWWYSSGAKKVAIFCIKEIIEASHHLSIKILLSHWFKPMYGQYDIAGRIISFFFRTLQLIWHSLLLLIWIILILIIFLVWLGLPIFSWWQISTYF